MTTFDIKMPKLGESITEGTIVAWSVKVGDAVKEDDILFEVTTAKVNAEIPSPVAGTVLEILFREGDTVAVGTVVVVIQIEGENTVEQDAPSDTASDVIETSVSEVKEERWYSPVVLRLANEANIPMEELDKIQGSGYLERLSKKDIQRYITQKKDGVSAPSVAVAKKPEPVVEERVKTAVATTNEDQVVEMDPVRRIIADHMVLSKKTSPHVTTFVEVDVTKLVEWRKRNKDSFLQHEGINLTYMPVIVEATAKALIAYPMVNASVDEYRMILKKRINIGIAVALDDGNLVVPVVHDADKLSISGLAQVMDSLAANARANKLKIDDIQGGTFTITNFGTFKNIAGTPIINQPQVAILGVGYIVKKPAVLETADGDVIAIRHKMILSLSYDHRIVNGALGGKFLLQIADYLENWDSK
jgi:Pyruvate/2-oxoglutarate dehydrogenase complex, dihydrolipoamide acyltransferase (E2) component, and related enzymes